MTNPKNDSNSAPNPKGSAPFIKISVTHRDWPNSIPPGDYYERVDNIERIEVIDRKIVISTPGRTYEISAPRGSSPVVANDMASEVLKRLGITQLSELGAIESGSQETWKLNGEAK